jgi:uncharacterized protein (TIGR02145 family)
MRKSIYILFIFIFLIIFGCKKDVEKPIISLDPEKNTYFPFEMITIKAKNNLGNAQLGGWIITQNTFPSLSDAISLVAQDSTISFFAPQLDPGSYKITFQVNGADYQVAINIKKLDNAKEPDVYMQEFTTKTTARVNYLKERANLLSNPEEVNQAKADAQALQNYLNDLQIKYQSLSVQDKQAFAGFMTVNEPILAEFSSLVDELIEKISGLPKSVSDDENIISQSMAAFPISTGIKALGIGLGVALLYRGTPMLKFIGIVLIISVMANAKAVESAGEQIINTPSLVYKDLDISQATYQNGVAVEVNVSATYRSLYKDDLSVSQSNLIQSFINAWEGFAQGFNYLKAKLPDAIKPTWTVKSINSITNYVTKTKKVHNNYLTISNISNNKVTLNVEKLADGSTKITATTNEAAKQTFTFDITYSSDFAQNIKKTISASVEANTNYVKDIDGNIYNIVKIGSQYWFKENLKTTKYNNGDAIINEQDITIWDSTKNGFYAVYDNNPTNNVLYGKLYNFFAISDPRGVCPTGWHIPTDQEWQVLLNYLGGSDIAGAKMKTSDYWESDGRFPVSPSNNNSGLSILPAGYIVGGLNFREFKIASIYWSSTLTDIVGGYSWAFGLTYITPMVSRRFHRVENGFSCRCIKDN